MATAWIEEYREIGQLPGPENIQVPALPAIRTQKVTFTTTASAAVQLHADTSIVVVSVSNDSAMSTWAFGFSSGVLATTNDAPLFSGLPRAFALPQGPGRYISFRSEA